MAKRTDGVQDAPPQDAPHLGLGDALAVIEEEKTELDKILQLFLDPSNVGHLTELNANEVLAFSVLSTIEKRRNLPVLQQFLRENLIYRISKGRKGRLEVVKMMTRQLHVGDQMSMMDMQPGRMGRLFGRRQPPR